jgi:hypothetical protein
MARRTRWNAATALSFKVTALAVTALAATSLDPMSFSTAAFATTPLLAASPITQSHGALALTSATPSATPAWPRGPLDPAASTATAVVDDAERLPQPALKPLFPDRSIKGWHIVGGTAEFTMRDGVLTGSGTDTRNAFLVSPRNYGDFVLDLELRIDEGNSGIQIRSQVREDEGSKSLVGYQVEIDPTPRAWSGGIYDEGRRGWLFDLEGNEAARKAFKAGEWNRYVIECRGPWFRTWVNGVPAANGVDIMDEDGRIAFQVHSGRTIVQWRRVMIAELPSPKVVSMFDGGALQGWSARSGPPWPLDGIPPHARLVNPATEVEPSALVSDEAYGDCVAIIEGRCDDPGAALIVRLPEGDSLGAGVRSKIGVDRLRDGKDHAIAVAIKGTRVNTFVDRAAVGDRDEPSMPAHGRMAILGSSAQKQGTISIDRARVMVYPPMEDPRVGPPMPDRVMPVSGAQPAAAPPTPPAAAPTSVP